MSEWIKDPTTYTDPYHYTWTDRLGMSGRKIVNLATREGWKTRKIYGHIWIECDALRAYWQKQEATQ